jgi:hypothetical protein
VPPAQRRRGYSKQFLAEVKDGVLTGQGGSLGQPSSMTLNGKIQPDGKASIDVRGMTGDPKFTATRAIQGSCYSYRIDAVFDDTRGSGKRTLNRPCDLTFFK